MLTNLLSKRIMASTAMPQKRVEFYYDVISPYSWFAFEVLMRYKKHWDVGIELKPFFLAGVGQAAGNTPPGLVPNKGLYMTEDLKRCARYFNVPLNMLSDPFTSMFKKGSLIPGRYLTAIDMLHPECLEGVSRALWMELWNKDEDITTLPVLSRAGKAGGLSEEQIAKIQEYRTSQAVKGRFKAYTDQAFEYGGFGSPTIIAHAGGKPMLFFGSDRFPVLANEIGEKWLGPDPDTPEFKL